MFTSGLLALLFLCMSIGHSYSTINDQSKVNDDINTDLYPSGLLSFLSHRRQRPNNIAVPLSMTRRQLYPAASYVERPQTVEGSDEYVRGKRFWLFAKNDGADVDDELVVIPTNQHNSLTKGLWRSGIVGRRRR